jgi:hypothetical protein
MSRNYQPLGIILQIVAGVSFVVLVWHVNICLSGFKQENKSLWSCKQRVSCKLQYQKGGCQGQLAPDFQVCTGAMVLKISQSWLPHRSGIREIATIHHHSFNRVTAECQLPLWNFLCALSYTPVHCCQKEMAPVCLLSYKYCMSVFCGWL